LKYLILDSSYICYRNKYKIKDLPFNEIRVGIIYGYLEDILKLAEKHKTPNLIHTWDSQKSIRKELYPEYKNNRNNNLTEKDLIIHHMCKEQFPVIRKKILPKLGFRSNFICSNYESDDIIAKLCEKYHEKYDLTVISRDKDLYQLLDYCNMWNFETKEFYTKESFKSQWGIDSNSWGTVKTYSGCSSDNVDGVPNVREKTAIKYLNGTLNKNTKAYKNIENNNGQRIAFRNKDLVLLPCPLMNGRDFEIKKDQFSLDGLIEICNEYGFVDIVNTKKLDRWRKCFEI